MDAKRDADIDPSPLHGKRVAIIGYGNQGRPQARNLKDSGIDVVVGLRDGSQSASTVASDGLSFASTRDAAGQADVVMLLAPDEVLAAVTINAAQALGLAGEIGSLEGGKQADLVVWNVPTSRQIPYWPAADLVRTVVKRGRVVLDHA